MDGAIGPITVRLLNGALDRARADGAQALIVELEHSGRARALDALHGPEHPQLGYPGDRLRGADGRPRGLGRRLHHDGRPRGRHGPRDQHRRRPSRGDRRRRWTRRWSRRSRATRRPSRGRIATERGRNVEWAEKAVRSSVSATEREAVKLKVVDLIADSVPDLLAKVDGRVVKTSKGTGHACTRVTRSSSGSRCASATASSPSSATPTSRTS